MKTCTLILFFFYAFVQAFSQKHDSSHVPITVFYTYDEPSLSLNQDKSDTLITQFQNYLPFYGDFLAHLGNGMTATYSLMPDFTQNEPFWLTPIKPYLEQVEHRYFDTHKPFTYIRLASNSNRTYNEEGIKLIHSQNINAHWNVTFQGLAHKDIGRMPRQDTRFHYLGGSTYYHYKQYHLLANYMFSVLKTNETGGVRNLSFLTDSLYPAENAEINSSAASNNYNVQNAFIRQWFSFRKVNDSLEKISPAWKPLLVMQSSVTRAKKIYKDVSDSLAYASIFLDSTATNDSLYYRDWLHKIGVAFATDLLKGSGIAVYGSSSFRKTFSYNHPLNEQSYGVSLEAFYRKPSFSGVLIWNQWFNGFLLNNQDVNVNLQKKVLLMKRTFYLTANVSKIKKSPDEFFQHLFINNFKWDNSFPLMHILSLNAGISDSLNNTSLHIIANSVKNIIVFDSTQKPVLIPSTINMFGLTIHKSFRLKNIVLYNSLMAQVASNEKIPVPLLAGYHILYFENALFKKVLGFQIGASVFYHTMYKAPSYNPASGAFYYTNSSSLGDYPFIDVFVNLKLKRARFFFKVEHLNYHFQKGNYCLIQNYPMPPRTFKFGIAWNFYD